MACWPARSIRYVIVTGLGLVGGAPWGETGAKKKPIEPTAEMDGSGAKIQVQLPAE